MAETKRRKKDRTVIFEVKTQTPLSVGEQVFVTGSLQALGNWRADGFPLTRMGENAWSGAAILPNQENVEYKLTRGTWDTEEVLENGYAPENSVLKAGGDTTVRRMVASWLDKVRR